MGRTPQNVSAAAWERLLALIEWIAKAETTRVGQLNLRLMIVPGAFLVIVMVIAGGRSLFEFSSEAFLGVLALLAVGFVGCIGLLAVAISAHVEL